MDGQFIRTDEENGELVAVIHDLPKSQPGIEPAKLSDIARDDSDVVEPFDNLSDGHWNSLSTSGGSEGAAACPGKVPVADNEQVHGPPNVPVFSCGRQSEP